MPAAAPPRSDCVQWRFQQLGWRSRLAVFLFLLYTSGHLLYLYTLRIQLAFQRRADFSSMSIQLIEMSSIVARQP